MLPAGAPHEVVAILFVFCREPAHTVPVGKKFYIVLAVLFVALLGVIIWRALRAPEPESMYQGKPLSFWLGGYYSPYGYMSGKNMVSVPTRSEAEAAMRHFGTNALPVLLRMLRERDSSLKDKLCVLAMRQKFIKFHFHTSREDIYVAMMGLHALGPQASNAVPRLVAIYVLHPNSLSQQIVPAILGDIGPPARAAIPLLIQATTDTNDNVRMNSVYALGQVHAEPELVVPVLMKCLIDSSSDIRASAARSLGTFGKGAQQSVPALLKLLKDEQAKSGGGKRSQPAPNWRVGNPPRGSSAGTLASADVAGAVTDALHKIDSKVATEVPENYMTP